MTTTILTRDSSSGRLHKRIQIEDSDELLTYEGCNLDEAGAFEVVDEGAITAADPEALCVRCFPDAQA